MDIENCKVAMRMMHNGFWFLVFFFEAVHRKTCYLGKWVRAEPFAWSYKHASTFLEVVAQQRAVILNVLNYTLLFACDERMTARY